MSHDFEVRVNGVIRLAGQITEVPSYSFDGKKVTIVADLVEEPPVPDVPRMNYDDIQTRLAAEAPADQDQGEPDRFDPNTGNQISATGTGEGSPEGDPQGDVVQDVGDAGDGESSQLDDKPRAK